MAKLVEKQKAIGELKTLMDEYVKYVESVKDKVFDENIKTILKQKGDMIRWIANGLENGYYD